MFDVPTRVAVTVRTYVQGSSNISTEVVEPVAFEIVPLSNLVSLGVGVAVGVTVGVLVGVGWDKL